MAKKRSKYDLALLRRTQAAEAEIDSIYREAVRRITRLGYSRKAPDGRLFSFDEAGAIVKQQFNAEQRKLMTSVVSAIREDVRNSWKLANKKNDEIVQTVLKDRGMGITDRLKRRYFSTNDEALAAFITRKTDGLGLSDRVWKYSQQFKSEIEMAIDIGLRDGRSADELSRDVRAYLQNPDKLFRRVRNKHGQLVLSKAAKAYHPGRGVYRSSYKNARRLASTETNIAYHKADMERWAQLDFIVGFKIVPSKNHPEPDICDDLAGAYPKTFDFSGWHPHCRCHAEPIMKTDEEMVKDNAAILAGAEPSAGSVNAVRNVPPGFSEWVKANGARIDAAKSLPYFIRDNKAVVDNILNPKPVRSALDIAEERHAARTTEQERTIRRAWTLRSAEVRHDARTEEQKQAIKKAWYDRKATLHYGNSMLNVMGGIPDASTAALAEAMKRGNLDTIMAEAAKLKAVGKEIYALDVLDQPMKVAKQFSFAKAKEMSETVKHKLDYLANFPLQKQIELLEPEMKYFTDPNYHMPHELSEWTKSIGNAYAKAIQGMEKKKEILAALGGKLSIAQNALSENPEAKELAVALKAVMAGVNEGKVGEAEKMLAEAMRQVDKLEVAKPLQIIEGVAKDFPGNDELAKSIKSAKKSLREWRLDEAKEKIAEMQNMEAELVIKRADGAFDAAAYTQERKNAAVWDVGDGKVADSKLINEASRAWLANKENRDYVYEYTSHYCDVNEPLQNRRYQNYQTKERFTEKVNAITEYINSTTLPHDMWFTRGDDGMSVVASRIKFAGGEMPDNLEDLVGQVMQEGGFMSTASRKGKGFSEKSVIFNVYAPKGTHAAYVEPFSHYGKGDGINWNGYDHFSRFGNEQETLFQRGTKMRITKIHQDSGKTWIDCEVIGQEVKDLSYVLDENIGYDK